MPLLMESHLGAHDSYHGTEVSDPYRWLEQRADPDTEHWITDQQQRAKAYFSQIPAHEPLETELTRRLDIDVMDELMNVAERSFCRLRRQGQERASIYVKDNSMGSWQLLVDVSTMEASTSLSLYRVSSDASAVAVLKRVGGSDQTSVHCFDVATGTMFDAHLDRGYARGMILCSSRGGFFYCHDKPHGDGSHQIRFTDYAAVGGDDLVFERPRTRGSKLILAGNEEMLGASHVYEQDGQRLLDFWLSDRSSKGMWKRILEGISIASHPFIFGKRLFLLTRHERNGFAISELDLEGQELRRVAEVLDGDIRGIACTATHLYATVQRGMMAGIQYWSLADGTEGTIPAESGETLRLLPSPGHGESVFFTRESCSHPPVVFEHGADVSCRCVFGESESGSSQLSSMTSYTAADGTLIPVTLTGLREDRAPQPVIILVYGAFGSSLLPQFSVLFNLFTEMGALLAVLHVRGGGENGRAWHDAGKRQNKPMSISDVMDGVEWLSQQLFVDSSRIALYGASAGGLLVAAVAMKIPEQLKAVVCIGPLLDMLRYQEFGLARRWKEEFGTSEDRGDFDVLLSYSPYHKVASSPRRPAFLFVTGDEDDRCDPAHVRKMAARLMETSASHQPVIVDYSTSRGHTPGLPLSERVKTLARRCAFLTKELDLDIRTVRCA